MKTKFTARIFTAALAAVMLFSVGALAADIPNPAATRDYTPHQSGTLTRSAGGHTYDIYSIVYISGKSAFASVWLETEGHVTVPQGNMGSQPTLYQEGGKVLASTDMVYSSTATYYHFQNTPTARFSDYVFAGGLAKIYNGSGYTSVVAPDTAHVLNSALMTRLTDTLDSNGTYPVNAKGQSYGSGLLASTVGHAPDLISAIGVDGVEGYILRTDIDPDITTREGALLHTALANDNLIIPLYDEECNEIGTFELSPVPQEVVDNAVAALNEMGEDAYQTALADLNLVDGQYPVNSKGQTYGPYGLIKTLGYAPDLVSAVGDDGVEGYILREDIEGPEVNTPEEAMESMLTANDRLIIPLFDVEGNEIGTFHKGPISEEHVAGARAALAQMRGE